MTLRQGVRPVVIGPSLRQLEASLGDLLLEMPASPRRRVEVTGLAGNAEASGISD